MNIWSHIVNSLASIAIGALVTHCTMGEAKAQSVPFNAYSVSTLGGNCTAQGSIMVQTSGGKSVCLAAGGNGQLLESGGIGADVKWANVSGTGTVTGPASSTVGNIALWNSTTGTAISDSGVSLPAGAIVGTTDTQTLTNKSIDATEINSGTLATSVLPNIPAAKLPTPTPTTLGGVKSATAPTNEFQTGIDTSGSPTFAQPSVSNLSGTLQITQGGTGQTSASAAFDALSPTTTQGDLILRGSSGNARLGIGTSGYGLISNGTTAAWAGFLQSGTGAVIRTWNDKAADILNAKDFGVKCDGVTNDQTNIQAAIDAAIPSGKTVILPVGVCVIGSTGIIVNNTSAGNSGGTWPVPFRTGLIGQGPGATIIQYSGGGSAVTIEVGDAAGTKYGNFSIVQSSAAKQGNGIFLTQTHTAKLEHLNIQGFSIGVDAVDDYSCKFDFNVYMNNDVGFLGTYSAYAHPNDYVFTANHWLNNTTYGINLQNPTTASFLGGSFEENGSGNSGDAAMHINGNPADGAAGLNVDGTYFEGNWGQADILIDNLQGNVGIHNIANATFNRVDATKYVTNNIAVYAGTAKTIVRLSGNGFEGFNSYVPNAGHLYYAKSDPNSVVTFSVASGANLCSSATEAPSGC